MSTYVAEVRWSRDEQIFTDNRYSRVHRWRFDGGIDVVASSSPSVVPLPMSSAAAVDPEEAFVASLSSCHMLWFLSVAAERGFCVDEYVDHASGVMGRNPERKLAMLRVTLRPEVKFSGASIPSPEDHAALHHEAHEQCFIASSVKTEVGCEPILQRT
jgi:organic hydroperoxide reductase OsmC/OhrA